MARSNIPIGVREEVEHTYLSSYITGYNSLTSTSINRQTVNDSIIRSSLEDGVLTKKGTYGAVLLNIGEGMNLSFSVKDDFALWVTGSVYGDGGGVSGKGLNIYKINSDGSKGDLYKSITSTQTNSAWYKLFEGEKGSYRIEAQQNYVVFDEMYFEQGVTNKFLISSDDKYYSVESSDSTVNLIPKMTSNTAPSGNARASSDYGGSYPAWKAFNETNTGSNDLWITGNVILTGWLEYMFDEPKIVNRYSLTSIDFRYANDVSPVDWEILGSNDGVNYAALHVVVNQIGWAANQTKTFDFENFKSYKYYRINVSRVTGALYVGIANFRLFASDTGRMTTLNHIGQESFVQYGMNKNTGVDLITRISNVVHIANESETLGDGKVFKVKIDKKIKSLSID